MPQVTVVSKMRPLPTSFFDLITDDRYAPLFDARFVTSPDEGGIAGLVVYVVDIAPDTLKLVCTGKLYSEAETTADFRIIASEGLESDRSTKIGLTIQLPNGTTELPQPVIDWISAVVELLNDIRQDKGLPTIDKVKLVVCYDEQPLR